MDSKRYFLDNLNERLKAIRQKKIEEDYEGFRANENEKKKEYYHRIKQNETQKYQRMLIEKRIKYYRKLKDSIEPEEFIKRYINLEKRNKELAEIIRKELML